MRRHPVSNSYARAMLEIAQASGQGDAIAEELTALRDGVFSQPELRVFLESPKIPRGEKKATLAKALEGKVSESVSNLVMILIDRGRQFLFSEIVDAYRNLCDEASGRTHVQITSAAPLSEESRESLVALLGKKLGREVVAQERVSPELLGGMTIRIGDMVVDGSVRSRLNEVREQVASRRLGSDLIDEN